MKIYGVQPKEQQPTIDSRHASIMEQSQKLNVYDTACLLDYVLGLLKTDTGAIDKVERWLKTTGQTIAKPEPLTLAQLNEMSAVAEHQNHMEAEFAKSKHSQNEQRQSGETL
jgi:hypothetical protein